MPYQNDDKRTHTIWLHNDLILKLDHFSQLIDISRSRIVNKMINVAVEILEDIEKSSHILFAVVIHKLRKEFNQPKGTVMKPMSIWIEKDLVSRLDVLADTSSMTRSKLSVLIIGSCLNAISSSGKIHLLSIRKIIEELKVKLKNQYTDIFEKEIPPKD